MEQHVFSFILCDDTVNKCYIIIKPTGSSVRMIVEAKNQDECTIHFPEFDKEPVPARF